MLRIEAPDAQPEKGGLLNVVTPKTNIEGFAFEYGVTFESVLAGAPQAIPDAGEDKEFGTVKQVEFKPFTVYSGIEAPLFDDEAMVARRIEDAFEGNLSKAVESGIQRTILNVDTEVLNGDGVRNPRLALGMLEQWASENIGTLAMIHTNRKGASILRDLKAGDDALLRTKQGSLIANGGGYTSTGPDGSEAGETQAWMYVSRVPAIYRSETQTTPGLEIRANKRHILAEASFVPIIEGDVAAVLLEGEPS